MQWEKSNENTLDPLCESKCFNPLYSLDVPHWLCGGQLAALGLEQLLSEIKLQRIGRQRWFACWLRYLVAGGKGRVKIYHKSWKWSISWKACSFVTNVKLSQKINILIFSWYFMVILYKKTNNIWDVSSTVVEKCFRCFEYLLPNYLLL